jgi:hypothetical protein
MKRALLRKLDEAREAELTLRGNLRRLLPDETVRKALLTDSVEVMRALDEAREMVSRMREEP